jgi:hypothetical protein
MIKMAYSATNKPKIGEFVMLDPGFDSANKFRGRWRIVSVKQVNAVAERVDTNGVKIPGKNLIAKFYMWLPYSEDVPHPEAAELVPFQPMPALGAFVVMANVPAAQHGWKGASETDIFVVLDTNWTKNTVKLTKAGGINGGGCWSAIPRNWIVEANVEVTLA